MALWSAGGRIPNLFSDEGSGPPWVETPLIHSRHISDRLGLDVYLKMEVKHRNSSHLEN